MLKLPIPALVLKSIYDLKPEALTEMGKTLLLMDLDNTLAKYHAAAPSVRLRNWIDSMKRSGIEPFIYSNCRGNGAQRFAEALSIEYVNKARKPKAKLLIDLLKRKGIEPDKAVIIGDQIFTDVLCGVRAGITTIAIRPIDMRNPFYFVRYGVEMPFRYASDRRSRKSEKKA